MSPNTRSPCPRSVHGGDGEERSWHLTPEGRAFLHRVEEGPVALLDLVAFREGRPGFLAERAHDAVVAVVAEQHDAAQCGERCATFGAEGLRHFETARGWEAGERAA